jgi:peptide/nickel transport system ATP-binding protein
VAFARCLTLSPEVLVMKDGVVVEQASAEQILAAPQEDYTRRLLAAIPRSYVAAA